MVFEKEGRNKNSEKETKNNESFKALS